MVFSKLYGLISIIFLCLFSIYVMNIQYVDVCCGLSWGDEGKGKIVSQLSKSGEYDFVCRWSGGSNAGHTVYVNDQKYATHIIPSGIFYGVKSIIGPGCVIHYNSFMKEINYLRENGFDTRLVKISPRTHIVTGQHIEEDKQKYSKTLGTTGNGIGPCYRDKYLRVGKRVMDDVELFKDYLWDEKLYGNILCEGAQGFWLDIEYGNYPYVTSSSTLPYGACSLGFSPKQIRHIYGAVKIYDTRVGYDPDFSEDLLDNEELRLLGEVGCEFGTTTGRQRSVNYLQVDKLITAINCSGTTHLIISKVDIAEKVGVFKYYFEENLHECENIDILKETLIKVLKTHTNIVEIIFSSNPTKI